MDFQRKFLITVFISAMLFTSAQSKVLGINSIETNDIIETNVDNVIGDSNASEEKLDQGKNKIIDNHIITDDNQSFDEVVLDMDKVLKEKDEPCTLFDPPSPNFQTEGRRISEAKCLDYIWEIKKTEETQRRVKQCMARHADFTTIVGGRDAKPGEFPHMGALGWKKTKGGWSFMCGSFLVSDKFVLTAAHCQTTDDISVEHPRPKIVRFGVENIVKDEGRTPVDIKILKFIKHPNYRPPPYKTFDIAVVELTKRVTFDKFVQPACILSQNVDKAVVTGWGVVETMLYSTKTSDELKVADVDIIPSDVCSKKLKKKMSEKFWKKVQSHQICATKLHGSADTCHGDSGGPLQAKLSVGTEKSIYNVFGVTSFGFICGRETFPSIYTKVSSFIDWIESNVWSDYKRELRSLYNEDSGEDKTMHVHKVQHFSDADLYWLDKFGGRWSYIVH